MAFRAAVIQRTIYHILRHGPSLKQHSSMKTQWHTMPTAAHTYIHLLCALFARMPLYYSSHRFLTNLGADDGEFRRQAFSAGHRPLALNTVHAVQRQAHEAGIPPARRPGHSTTRYRPSTPPPSCLRRSTLAVRGWLGRGGGALSAHVQSQHVVCAR